MRWLSAVLGTSVLALCAAGAVMLAWDELGVAGAAAGEGGVLPHAAEAATAPQPAAAARREGRVRRPERFYAAIEARPLFAPSRRPAEEVPLEEVVIETPEEVETPAPAALDAALKGVMSGGRAAKALLAVEGGDPEWLAVGERLGAWTLAEVASGHVTLARGEERMRLELER